MATGRRLSREFFRDGTLSLLTFGHRAAYAGIFVHADDYGRYSGDPIIWKSDIFPRDKHVTEDVILAMQHDLANAELIGFYTQRGESYCLVYKFFKHQHLREVHVTGAQYPTPPLQMWPCFSHPSDAGRGVKIDDMPYEAYKKACAEHEIQAWLPPQQRPELDFGFSVYCPFGAIRRPQPVEPVASPPPAPALGGDILQTTLLTDATPVELATLKVFDEIKGWKFDHISDLKYIRELARDFAGVDILKVVRDYKAGLMDKPLTAKSRPHAQLRNWVKNTHERQTGTQRTGTGNKRIGTGSEARVGGTRKLR